MATQNIRFWYDNLWANYTLLYSSQHNNWPASNTKQRWRAKSWRSNYGNNSGFGTFLIDGTNDEIYFDEGGGTLNGTLTNGTYNTDSLATEIEIQLEAAGAHSYSVNYNDVTLRFEIVDETGTVQLELATTVNALWDTIGFDTGVDTAFIASHIADNIRIHTHEWVKFNGSGVVLSGVYIVHTNLQASAILRIEGSNDDFATINFAQGLSRGDNDQYGVVFAADETYDDWRIWVEDPGNSDGFIELGVIWLGIYFEPEIGTSHQETPEFKDPSLLRLAENRHPSTIQKDRYQRFKKTIMHVKRTCDTSTDIASFETLFRSRGTSLPFVVQFKLLDGATNTYTEPENNSYYSRFTSYVPNDKKGLYSLKFTVEEDL